MNVRTQQRVEVVVSSEGTSTRYHLQLRVPTGALLNMSYGWYPRQAYFDAGGATGLKTRGQWVSRFAVSYQIGGGEYISGACGVHLLCWIGSDSEPLTLSAEHGAPGPLGYHLTPTPALEKTLDFPGLPGWVMVSGPGHAVQR